MKLKNAIVYEEWKAKNTDGYGAAIYKYNVKGGKL